MNSQKITCKSRFAGIRLVSLDVGNTLVTSSSPGLATIVARATSSTPEARQLVASLQAGHLTQSDLDDVCSRLGVESIDLDAYTPPVPVELPGVVAALHRLRLAGFRIATLSNVVSVDATPLPESISELVDASYLSCRLGVAKPDPAAFVAMLDAEGLPAADVVHVGDSLYADVLGATSAGLAAIWLTADGYGDLPPRALMVSSLAQAVDELIRGLRHERQRSCTDER